MLRQRPIRIIASILAILLLAQAVSPSIPDAYGAKSHLSIDELEQLSNQLTKEIFELNLQQALVAREKEELTLQLVEIEASLAEQEEDLIHLMMEAQLKWEDLASWLRFAFINLRVSFLYLLFAANTFTDLYVSWYLVEKIVAHQAKLIRELLQVQRVIVDKKAYLTDARDQMNKKIQQVAQLEYRIISLTKEKLATLEVIRQAEREYGINILAEEQYWQELMASLEELLLAFKTFKWEQLEPRRIELQLLQRKVLAEFSQEDVARIMAQSTAGSQFILRITEQGMVFSKAGDERSVSFLARLTIVNNKLELQPEYIAIKGVTLSPDLVKKLAGQFDLTAPLPEVHQPGVTASKIWAGNGYLTVEFRIQ
ncbi:MAG: hypothetical protein SCK28_02555 [Bacillota bacterium]|nr:hypothetical protein [Bacillota bacterium]